ncbi:MAG: hypothetical protein ABSB78_00945 [Bacteroidota bacterium]
MIKNRQEVEQIEREFDRTHPLTLEQKFELLESMYQLARQFGHFTSERLLDGIEHDIELTRILNANVTINPLQNSKYP